jgi:peroxiredoxin
MRKSENKADSDFISANKYNFHVLMDNDDKVVEQFKVEEIPTKFVIDKNGIIRFKAVGFDGSDDKLIEQLTAMINMASEEVKKTF